MNKLHKQITTLSSAMIFIAAVITTNPALAANTTLNGVEISSSTDRGYDIVLNTDTATNVQKKSVNSDKLVLDLKNTTVSKDADTVYKNADGIENVILKPKANDLQIEINGKAAGSSKVSLNNEIPAASPKNYSNTVFINQPLNSYAPIHEENLDESAEGAGFLGLISKIFHSQSLKNLLGSSNLGWIISLMLMFGFLATRNLKGKTRKQVSVKISNTPDKENNLLKAALERKEGLIAEGMGTQQRRTQIQPKPQQQVSAQRANYGLKAYNNQPMGASTSSFRTQNNMPLRNTNNLNIQPNLTNRTSRMATSTATAQELKTDIKRNEVRIDNVKFLESMAKIYERSGRADLATGLANNIKKAKTIR